MRDENGNVLFDSDGQPKILEKGNLDIELVIDAVMTHSMFDEMVLFSGDSDFLSLVNFMQNR